MSDNEGLWDSVTILRKNKRQIQNNKQGANIRNGTTETVKKQEIDTALNIIDKVCLEIK